MREIGAGSLHWFGLRVYDARLAVALPRPAGEPARQRPLSAPPFELGS